MENNFDKHIMDSMNNPPEFPFEERLWKDMEGRLDKDKDRNPLAGFMGGLPLLLITLFMTSLAGYFYVKQHKAMDRIAVIEQQLNTQEQSSIESTIEKRVTVIYDTIYNKVVVNELVEQEYSSKVNHQRVVYISTPGPFSSVLDTDAFAQTFKAANYSISDFVQSKGYGIVDEFAEKRKQERLDKAKEEIAISLLMPTSQLPTLSQGLFTIEQNAEMPALNIIEKKRKKRRVAVYFKQLKPTRFVLSGTTGTFTSLNLGSSGFNLRGSAHAEIGMGNRFGITGGVEYFSNDFNKMIDPLEVDATEGFPDLSPNNDEDVLLSIQGDFNYLQVPFGIKYVVFPRRYFYPYIGAGLIAGKTTKSRLEYEYQSLIGPYSISEGRLLPNKLELNAFYGTLGFQVQMNKHWSLLVEGSSQFDMKKGIYRYENLELLKLSTGVQYQF